MLLFIGDVVLGIFRVLFYIYNGFGLYCGFEDFWEG